MFDFKDKTAVVTGGAQGIGKGICEAFLKAGARLAYIDFDADAVAEADSDFSIQGYSPVSFLGDLSDTEQIKNFFHKVSREFHEIDFLINNAAISNPESGGNIELFEHVLRVNLVAPFACTYFFSHIIREGGSIVNIASTRALMSEKHTEAYSASKGGIVSLTHASAISLGPKIRVNAVSPGWINVSAYQKTSEREIYEPTEADKAQHPVGRVGEPADIANMCLYLCSGEASFITGQNFVVDGGMTKKMIYV